VKLTFTLHMSEAIPQRIANDFSHASNVEHSHNGIAVRFDRFDAYTKRAGNLPGAAGRARRKSTPLNVRGAPIVTVRGL